ncbi:MAG: hypothetical protein A2W23_07475 [Planctomycetes bacterium RBG_16_43_13]|nr:MAG: hypothetical protein A2W23_07475 [Planctomycetes bacterium RBG_16_43_13]
MKQIIAVIFALSLLPIATNSFAQTIEDQNKSVYENTYKSVVAVRALTTLGERTGSGVILDKDGYILTSAAIVPPNATNIRVWLKGPKLVEAKLVGSFKELEIAIVKITAPNSYTLSPMEFGDSRGIKVGSTTYTLGNAFDSIINDDHPSFSAGVVSGVYKLTDARIDSTYIGTVIETTAAVNPGMEGSPLINAEGRMVGLITPNFSTARWLGNAIPIDTLKHDIELLKKGKHPSQKEKPQDDTEIPRAGKPYLGVTLEEKNGQLVVAGVDKDSPAEESGIAAGDVIVELSGAKIGSVKEFWEKVNALSAGAVVWIKVAGTSKEIKVTLGEKK